MVIITISMILRHCIELAAAGDILLILNPVKLSYWITGLKNNFYEVLLPIETTYKICDAAVYSRWACKVCHLLLLKTIYHKCLFQKTNFNLAFTDTEDICIYIIS